MNPHGLSDEETVVIFGSEAAENLESLDAPNQRQVISRLRDIASSPVPPSGFRRERIANLDIVAAGDTTRLYTKIVENVPQGKSRYHVVFVFHIDVDHEYRRTDLARYTRAARTKVATIQSFEHVDRVDEYLAEEDALTAGDLEDLLS